MTKQEKIKEELYSVINNHTRGKLTPSERKELRDAILEYEDSHGVVLKVEGALPKPIKDTLQECKDMKAISAHAMSIYVRVCPLRNLGIVCEDCKELAGYSAFESLIDKGV